MYKVMAERSYVVSEGGGGQSIVSNASPFFNVTTPSLINNFRFHSAKLRSVKINIKQYDSTFI
jgi:hypothetical protein